MSEDQERETVYEEFAGCFIGAGPAVAGIFLMFLLIGWIIENIGVILPVVGIVVGIIIALVALCWLFGKIHNLYHSWPNVFFFFLFLPIFIPFWLVDRWAFRSRSIHVRCPKCKLSDERHSLRPIFICPNCGQKHNALIPGPNGLFAQKCACGKLLRTTFLGGRSTYSARCPHCNSPLFSTGSRQFGIQLVGGRGSGKTAFLAAFWTKYKELLSVKYKNMYEKGDFWFDAKPLDQFEKLEKLFQFDIDEPTDDLNSCMLSVVHQFALESIQASFYDVSGEIFEYDQGKPLEPQFGYCEGFLLFLDPTQSPDFSLQTTINFINAFNAVRGKHPSYLSDVPVAIIVPKADLFTDEFRFVKLRDAERRDGICRSFLAKHGFLETLNVIDASFSNVAFFPVISANSQWKPYGVLEAVSWLMSDENSPFNYGDERCVFLGTRYSMYEKA